MTKIKARDLKRYAEHADQIWMASLGKTDMRCHLLSQESGENPEAIQMTVASA